MPVPSSTERRIGPRRLHDERRASERTEDDVSRDEVVRLRSELDAARGREIDQLRGRVDKLEAERSADRASMLRLGGGLAVVVVILSWVVPWALRVLVP